jgi:peroxiredoxin
MPDVIPEVTFKTRVRDDSIQGDNPFRWEDVTSNDIFKDKTIVLFALPGAFTPTCSSTHLPGFEEKYQELKDLGVDEIYCLSVNDAFTMFQWAQKLGVENVLMLPDGNGEFTKGMDMMVKKENLGFGDRSWRYSMLVEDKQISKIFSEANKVDNCPEDPFEVSDAGTMINYIKDKQNTLKP